MRKIVQIGLDVAGESGCILGAVVALCDDGTMWELYKGKWGKLPDIPQEGGGE